MKRLPHVAMLLVAVALVAADKGEKKKGDAEKIQGKWKVVEFHHKGKPGLVGEGKVTFSFSGKRMKTSTGHKAAFELRPDKKPRELDFISNHGGKAVIERLIYELSGDTLKLCLLGAERPRPVAIGTAVDDDRVMLVLKRVKGDDKKKP